MRFSILPELLKALKQVRDESDVLRPDVLDRPLSPVGPIGPVERVALTEFGLICQNRGRARLTIAGHFALEAVADTSKFPTEFETLKALLVRQNGTTDGVYERKDGRLYRVFEGHTALMMVAPGSTKAERPGEMRKLFYTKSFSDEIEKPDA